ncbi:MAG: winged helix-turn-helix transcriptional regulator [Hyphomonadaceae bacterium]|nr:MAG: MarR family transcriptional regulator [Caulobacteraceae bacterium]MBT9447175.1 winged helix-turn-helix transcriptional regulator [Hyphomonadaceae bacterium]TPW08197.1 MAG: MarR family transcriptional regulator [Alphaproteobacteria bacterium]
MSEDYVKASRTAAASAPSPSARRGSPADTLHQILKLSNKLMTPFSVYLEHRYKISVNEFRLLMLIGRHGSTASHELAEMTGVNIMSVSRAVTTLDKHGRINVVRDPTNRRRKTLSLTDEGRRLFEIMRPQTDRVAEYLLSDLHSDEVMALNRFLATLIKTLEASDEEGRSVFLERTRPVGDVVAAPIAKPARSGRPRKKEPAKTAKAKRKPRRV